MKTPKGYSALSAKKHGMGGLIKGKLRPRKQDRRAKPFEAYAVIFFPTIQGIGPACMYQGVFETLAQRPETAKAKWLDTVHKSVRWADYHKAGHRIRKVKIIDLGDA